LEKWAGIVFPTPNSIAFEPFTFRNGFDGIRVGMLVNVHAIYS